jgi:hypothetical protein
MDDIKRKADHIWAYLDELHEKDPAAYDKFIAEQKESVKNERKKQRPPPPQPSFVVATFCHAKSKF